MKCIITLTIITSISSEELSIIKYTNLIPKLANVTKVASGNSRIKVYKKFTAI